MLIKILLQVVPILLEALNCNFEKVKLRFVLPLCACPNFLITCMITDQIGLHSVLLPLWIGKGVKKDYLTYQIGIWKCRDPAVQLTTYFMLCNLNYGDHFKIEGRQKVIFKKFELGAQHGCTWPNINPSNWQHSTLKHRKSKCFVSKLMNWHMIFWIMFNVIWFGEFCGWLSYLEYEQ